MTALSRTRHQSTEYFDENGELVVRRRRRAHDPEEVEEEIADLREEFNERKDLRTEAYETLMRIEPKMLISDETLYRELRLELSRLLPRRHGRRGRTRPAR